jgi:hypothetical protein
MTQAYALHAARPAGVPGRIFAPLCGVRCAVTVPGSMLRERGLHAEESVAAERTRLTGGPRHGPNCWRGRLARFALNLILK